MATNLQIKKIHTLKNVLGLDDDLYRDMLMSFGVCTSKDLTNTEANVFASILEEKAIKQNLWVKKSLKYEDLYREDMATPTQLRLIEGLWEEIAYDNDEKFKKTSLRKIIKNKLKVDDIRFLTKEQANKAINLIKGIKKNLKKRTAAL